jgi:hypothetical protein
VQPVSAISRLKNLFRPSPRPGNGTRTLYTQSRYLDWHIVEPDPYGGPGIVIADSKHCVIGTIREMDCAEEIVACHNKLVRAREEWYGA